MLHDASSSEPEAFDINVHELPAQKTSFDDDDSSFVDKQSSGDRDFSLQSVDTASSPDADLLPKSVTEQHGNADGQMLLTEEATSVTPHFQDLAVYESEDDVQVSRRPETAHSAQLVKLDISEHFAEEHSDSCTPAFPEGQRLASADSMADSTLITQQMPETRPLVVGDEAKFEHSVSEKHAMPYQGDQLKDVHPEVQDAIQEKIEEQPAELAFTENTENIDAAEVSDESFQPAVCADDFVGDDKISTVSFAFCSEEPSTQELERQPVSLPMLSDLALAATVDNVQQQPLAQADASATYVACYVEPTIYELPVEGLVAYDLEVPETDAVHAAMSERVEHFAEATINRPESEGAVQELAVPDLFGDFVVRVQSPETATCDEVKVPEDLLLAVESGEREVCIGTSATERMRIAEDNLSSVMKLPVIQMQREEAIVKPEVAVRHEAACIPEKPETVEEPTAETSVESDELLGAESIQRPGTDFPMTWRYWTDEPYIGSRDPDGEMPGLGAKYRDSYGEQYSVRYLAEDITDRSPFDFADMEFEYEYHRSDGDDEEETESATSDEWCVMEKERDFGLDVTAVEDLSAQTQGQVLADVGAVSTLTEKPVYDSSTHETSSEYRTCTSKRRL